MTPADTCVWCERPFPTSAEYERDHPDSCDDDPSCWCTGYCWRNDGGICENAANEATKERLVSQLRQRVASLDVVGELTETIATLQDRNEGLAKVIAAHREVAVQRMRGFVLHCPPGGDVWLKGPESELAGEAHCRVVWEINDAYHKAVNQ